LPLPLLTTAAFLSAAAARSIDPLLVILARDFQTSVSAVSVIIASFTTAYGCSQLLYGPAGDRFGRLRLLLGALIAYAILMAACASAGSLYALILLRAGAGAACGGLLPVCLAYLGDWVPYRERQIVISRVLTGFLVGQTLAGAIGGVFGQYLGWRAVFLILAGGGAATSLWLAIRLRGFPDRQSEVFVPSLRNYSQLARDRTARRLLVATLVEGALLAGGFPFVAPFLHDGFGLSYAAAGLVLACFGIGAFVAAKSACWSVPRFGEPGLVLAGGALVIVGFVLAAVSPVWPLLIATEAFLGFGYLTLHTVLQTRATELCPERRGTAVSCFVLMLFLGQSLGALVMSGLIAWLGYRDAFALDAIAVVPLVLWLRAFLRASRPETAGPVRA
jgi:predicted MFS family arabinose efflux permease